MSAVRSNKPIIILLSLLLVVIAGAGLFFMQQAFQPPEARENPTVVSTLPDGSGPASRATTLEFLFSQQMDHVSVEAALTLSPTVAYSAQWQSEGRGERLIVQPTQALSWETTYHATLAASAQNTQGRPLAAPITLSFTTGGQVQVAAVTPAEGTMEVELNQPITIRFDRPLVEVTSLEEQADLPQPVVIEPPLQGIGRWLAPDTYSFYPEDELTAGTEYVVRVSPAVAPAMELADAYEWTFTTTGPRLTASYPFDGASEVERATAITLLFSQPMDRESVEENFQLSARGEEVPVAGQFVWDDDRRLTFEPREPLELATDYQIEVEPTVVAQGGSRGLASPYRAVFTTVDYLTVESVQPAPGSDEVTIVPTDTVIAVQFNHPVVSLVGLADKDELPSPIRLSPDLSGEGEWVTTSLFVYRPTEPLAPSTEYVITLEPGLQDTLGSFLNEAYSWSFTTEFPRVVRVEPSNTRRLVAPEGPISLRFNQPMDEETTTDAFTLVAPDGSPVAGTFEWTEEGTVLSFFPTQPLTREEEYELVLGEGARGARGGATNERFEAEVVAAPLPRVVKTLPANGAENVSVYEAIQITFNTPITTTGLIDHLSIVPTSTNVYTYYDPETLSLNISVAGPLQPSTEYSITIEETLRDESGQSLSEPYTFGFTTAPLEPQLSLITPSTGGLVGTYNPYTGTLQLAQHRNLSGMTWSLYRMTREELIPFLGPEAYTIWEAFRGDPDELVESWEVEVDTPENLSYLYKTLVPPEGEIESGIYLLRVTAPEENPYTNQQLETKQLMVFTPINLTIKRASDTILVWATDMQAGTPVAGLEVELLTAKGESFGSGTTSPEGLFRYEIEEEDGLTDPYAPIFAISSDDAGELNGLVSTDWNSGISPYGWNVEETLTPQRLYGTIYTERPIYRPGQTVYYRGVLRQRDGSTLTLPSFEELTLTVSYQGEAMDSREITLSPFGTFSGEFTLDEEAGTGGYDIAIAQEEIGLCYGDGTCYWEVVNGGFQVAEYQRPEFEVAVEMEADAVVQGETVNATVAASYFFGGALGEAPFSWRLLSGDYFFDVPTLSGYWSWQDMDDLFFDRFQNPFPPLLREGKGTLDASGRATLPVETDLERGEKPSLSQRFIFEAEVRDVNDSIITGRGETIVHAGEFYIGLNQDSYVGSAGDPFTVNVATADTTGALVGEQEIAVEFYQREWYSVQEKTENGALIWTTSYSDTLVATRPAVTDEGGRTTVTFTPEAGGSYTALALGTDSQGNEVRSRSFLWVTDEGFVAWGRENNDRIELIADKAQYQVGDVARILIPTPYEGMTALITEEQIGIERATVQTLAGTAEVLEIPITEEMIPNRVVSVLAVTGMSEETPLPEFRIAYLNLTVVPTAKLLNVELSPIGVDDAEALEPGDEARFAVRVTDAAGQPVQAELSLAVVDKAILSLAASTAPSLEEAFYRPRPLAVRTGVGLIANVDRLSQRLSPEAKGGGGADAGRFGPESLRSNFVDTAFWQADIVTDAQGTAEVSFTLPDNLTTWVLTARAITDEATLVGEQTEELLTTLPLIVRPTLPRFFVVGDEADLRVVVSNNSGAEIETTVTFEAEGLTLRDGADATATLAIPAGGREVLTFPVTVDDIEETVVTVGAEGGNLSDRVQRTLPVYHLSAPEVVATGGILREGEGAAVETIRLPEGSDPTQGELTVEMAPSLAGATQSALTWLNEYPYEGVEMIVSVLLPNVATLRALNELELEQPELEQRLNDEISLGVQRLLTWQNNDGGWGWWRGNASQEWLTAYTLLGLHEASEQGIEVPEERLTRARRYLERWLGRASELQDDATLDKRAFLLYVLSETGEGQPSRAAQLFDSHALLNNDGKAFLLLALDNAGEAHRPQVQTLASELTASARLSATGAHWEEARLDRSAFDSSQRTTAVVLRAMVRVQPEHLLLPQTVRWLMVARKADSWGSTQDTAWSLLALTDYMLASGELEADFSYEVVLNDEVLLSERASQETLADPVTLKVGIAQLLLKEENRLLLTRVEPTGSQSGAGRLYYFAWLRYYLPVETLKARFEGISVARQYEAVDSATLQSTGAKVDSVEVGDLVQVRLTVNAPNDLYFFTLEDPIPAGFEVVDPALLTTSAAAAGPQQEQVDERRSPFWYGDWSQSVIRDEKVALFSDLLPRGTYEYTYLLRATVPGNYNVLPAVAYEHYFPEVFGRSEGGRFEVVRSQ